MNPLTHFLTGWALANCVPSLERKERAMVTLACVIPDVDGPGAVADLLTRNSAHPTEWFSRYHHQLHSLGFAIVVTVVCAVLARQRSMLGTERGDACATGCGERRCARRGVANGVQVTSGGEREIGFQKIAGKQTKSAVQPRSQKKR